MEWKHVVVGVSILAAVSCSSPCTEIGCGPEPDPYCQNVIEVRPNGPGCDPVCKVCNDTEVKPTTPPTRDNMVCPTNPYFNVPTLSVAPSQPVCSDDSECEPNEKCCYWGSRNQCRVGVTTTPKPGSCPIRAPFAITSNCLMDYVGCRYDTECRGHMKCCKVQGCPYSECTAAAPPLFGIPTSSPVSPPAAPSPPPKPCTRKGCAAPPAALNCRKVEIVYPNGDGCEPACRVCMDAPPPPPTTLISDQNLECPPYPFYFNVPVSQPVCTADSDCRSGEKCCFWGAGKQCKTGLVMTAKAGVCPVPAPTSSSHSCKMDYVGCTYDSQCEGDEKCCKADGCSYKECRAPTPALAAQPLPPQACTEIGCGPGPDPYCQNVIEVRPNGPGCDPVCKVCNDTEVKPTIPPSRDNLACPPYPLYFNIPLSQPACTADSDCRSGEKCCFWGAGKQCKAGLVMTAKAGVCPVPAPTSISHTCKMDYVGCTYDSQCEGDEKCCKADGCPYKECRAPIPALAAQPLPPQACTLIGCGPGPDPNCWNVIEVRPNGPGCNPVCKVCNDTEVKPTIPPSRDNLACPSYPFYFNIPVSQPVCTADSDCKSGEKCCFWGAGKQCKTGLVMTAKAGVCPVPAPKGSSHTCKMDYVGCSYDSQCEGDEKCCRADGCSYKECRAPTLALAVEQIPTQPPKICTLKGCAAPPAALNCTNVEIVYPNGEGCEPACRVCKVPKPPKVCTKRGCPPPLSSDCKKTKKYRPNGKGCGPVCEVCVDKPKLDCPSYPFYFDVELTQPECVSDKECKTGEKCCDWGSGKQCVKGVDTTRKPGVCPATKVADFVSSDCIADAPGCDFDSQCPGTEKCCLNSVCKYKECKPAVTDNCRWITKKRCHPTARKPNGKRKCRRIRKYVCQ